MEHMLKYHTRILGYFRRQDGAVTVDWVVLTAAIVGMGMAAAFSVGGNIPGLADQVSTVVANRGIVPD